MAIRNWLNDNQGALLAAAVIAIVGQSIAGYAKSMRDDDRWANFDKFAVQQQAMNDSQIKISEAVAVIATRVNYIEQDMDRVFANMPAVKK